MSMKRTKKASNTRGSQSEGSLGFNPPSSDLPKLDELLAGRADGDFVDYAPTRTFARGDVVSHAKFGRGYVVSVESGRVEVLFAEGAKKLAHGATP